jgi:hypothetical protein
MRAKEVCPNAKKEIASSRLGERRRALKQLGALSGLGAVNFLCGPELKAAALELVSICRPTDTLPGQGAARKKYRPLARGTSPKALTVDDLEMLGDLVELIIPTTEMPGARVAGVHWYIDAVAEVDAHLLQQLVQGLGWVREQSQQQFARPFGDLIGAQRTELLVRMSERSIEDAGRQFFQMLKQWTLDGYYKSEIGLLQELEWVGHEYLANFPGCPHPNAAHEGRS